MAQGRGRTLLAGWAWLQGDGERVYLPPQTLRCRDSRARGKAGRAGRRQRASARCAAGTLGRRPHGHRRCLAGKFSIHTPEYPPTSLNIPEYSPNILRTGNYDEYFGMATDVDAVVYLMLVGSDY